MSRYRKVEVAMWGDRKFRELSQDAKLLWVYLLTGPQTTTLPGLMRAGRAVLADDLDMTAAQIDVALSELIALGMTKADVPARLLWLPNAMKHNPPANPSIAVHWRKDFDTLPECELKAEAKQAICEFLNSLDVGTPADYAMAFVTGRKPSNKKVSDTMSDTVSDISSSSSNRSSKESQPELDTTKGSRLEPGWRPPGELMTLAMDAFHRTGITRLTAESILQRFHDDEAHQTPRVNWDAQWLKWVPLEVAREKRRKHEWSQATHR